MVANPVLDAPVTVGVGGSLYPHAPTRASRLEGLWAQPARELLLSPRDLPPHPTLSDEETTTPLPVGERDAF